MVRPSPRKRLKIAARSRISAADRKDPLFSAVKDTNLNNFTVQFQFDEKTKKEKSTNLSPIKEETNNTRKTPAVTGKNESQDFVELSDLIGYTSSESLEKQPEIENQITKTRKNKKVNNRKFYNELPDNFFEKYPKIKPQKEQMNHQSNDSYFDFFHLRELEEAEDSFYLIRNLNAESESSRSGEETHLTFDLNEEKIPSPEEIDTSVKQCIRKIISAAERNGLTEKHFRVDPIERRVQYLRDNINLTHCSQEEIEALMNTFRECSDVFQLPTDPFRHTDIYEHVINLKPHVLPINQRQFRIPEHYRYEVDRQIYEMEQKGIISRCDSPWNSPIFLVPKKPNDRVEKQYRLVIDYREVNKVIEPTSFPMPRIDEILDKMDGKKYFTTLDVEGAYHQVALEQKSRQYTAFSTSSVKYCFNSVPFGLVSSPFAWLMVASKIICGSVEEGDESLSDEGVWLYMDDVVVASTTLEQHLATLEKLFKRFTKHYIKLKVNKSKFLAKEVTYLGFIITTDGLRTDPKKTECISRYPQPQNVKQVQSFMGLCNYYRRYIDDYAGLARPLYDLCKKDEAFLWSEQCENAFREFKKRLSTPPLLIFPNFAQPFILRTDCSMLSASGILSQGEIPYDKPIHYFSKVLNPAQTRYSTIEKELLAIILSVDYFHYYLVGREFLIVTDHRPLTYLFTTKNISARLHRWRYALMSYQFQIIYKSGKSNVVADALSRIKIEANDSETEVCKKFEFDVLRIGRSSGRMLPESTSEDDTNKDDSQSPHVMVMTRAKTAKINQIENARQKIPNTAQQPITANSKTVNNSQNEHLKRKPPKLADQLPFIRAKKGIALDSKEYDYLFYIIQEPNDTIHKKLQHKMKRNIDLSDAHENELSSFNSNKSIIINKSKFRTSEEISIARNLVQMIQKFCSENGVENIAISIQFRDPISHFEFKTILYETFNYDTISVTLHVNEIM